MMHQDRPRMVRLSGDFVQMDPRTWNSHFDVEVNVALGAGSDQERVQTLQMFGAKQEEILKEPRSQQSHRRLRAIHEHPQEDCGTFWVQGCSKLCGQS